MWKVQLEENAIFQIPSWSATRLAPPSLFSEISMNCNDWLKPKLGAWLGLLTVSGLNHQAVWILWDGDDPHMWLHRTGLCLWKDCWQAVETGKLYSRNLPSGCSRDERHHLDGKVFPNTPFAIAIKCSVIQKTKSRQAKQKKRGA